MGSHGSLAFGMRVTLRGLKIGGMQSGSGKKAAAERSERGGFLLAVAGGSLFFHLGGDSTLNLVLDQKLFSGTPTLCSKTVTIFSLFSYLSNTFTLCCLPKSISSKIHQ